MLDTQQGQKEIAGEGGFVAVYGISLDSNVDRLYNNGTIYIFATHDVYFSTS